MFKLLLILEYVQKLPDNNYSQLQAGFLRIVKNKLRLGWAAVIASIEEKNIENKHLKVAT